MQGQTGSTSIRFFLLSIPILSFILLTSLLPKMSQHLIPHSLPSYFYSFSLPIKLFSSLTLVFTTSLVPTPSPSHFICCTRQSKYPTSSSLTTCCLTLMSSSAPRSSISSYSPEKRTYVSQISPPNSPPET